ncbi:MAG: hypothetical protein BroJett011_54730 [Chloroflexota bacterium]|nr:MAG: hypothetical protein BroJett011_54730 [Chloroflexota bacterium]
MKDAAEYIAYVKSLLISNSQVVGVKIVPEEAQDKLGLYRYRLSLADGGFLEMFERFEVVSDEASIIKYSFQWQDAAGTLRKRWDNATHHPEVSTHPHHLHDGSDENVLPHQPITAIDILKLIGG